MKKLLIDRRGAILPVERGLRRIGRYKLPYDSDPLTFAIRHLGVVEVAFGEWGARVRLRPGIASSRAVSELMYLLSDIRPRRFVLTHLQRNWEEELIPAFSTMVLRLEELVYGVRSRHLEKLFHAEERSLDPDQSLIPVSFARLLREWSQRDGRLPDNATLPFRRSGCLGRTTLVEERDDSRMVIAFRGRHLTHYGAAGWTEYVGQPVDRQPDMRFSSAASAIYAEAHPRAVPILQSCEGTIATPGGVGRRSIYERLILPWRLPDGRRFVSGVSYLRGRADWKDARNASASASIS